MRIAEQVQDAIHQFCKPGEGKALPLVSYYNQEPPVFGKNSERASHLISLAEVVGTLRYTLHSEGSSWPVPVRLSELLYETSAELMRSKFLSIPQRENGWGQRKEMVSYVQNLLGASSSLSLKRGSSDEDKDKGFMMAAAFIIAHYGLLQQLSYEVLQEMGITATLPPAWWETSPQLMRIAKGFVAGNIRALLKQDELAFESIFPKENEVCAENRGDL